MQPVGGDSDRALERCLVLLLEARRAAARGEDGRPELAAALAELGEGPSGADSAEESLDRLLGGPSTRLASYGSLRPGERHHDVVSHLSGTWATGVTTGALDASGEYPVLAWSPGGEPVPVAVLESDALADHWPEIDGFEGTGYVRAYVPVELSSGGRVVCSCYLASS